MKRLTAALALLAVLGWTCLLFGIGLDDLMDSHTRPGVIFSVVVLPILIAAAVYALVRVLRPYAARRFARPR
jgi:hypothetical protein